MLVIKSVHLISVRSWTYLDCRRILIVMLHLYGTRGYTKIWGENNFHACEEVQHAGGFRR